MLFQEKLHSVVNSLCVQAVHKILKAVRDAAVSPPLPEGAEDPPGGRGDPGGAEEISAGPEQRSEGLRMSTGEKMERCASHPSELNTSELIVREDAVCCWNVEPLHTFNQQHFGVTMLAC